MKFSIVIPAHNSAGHIHRALDSILEQSFQDYEIIVVCDNCDDSTEEIAISYGCRTVNVSFGNDGPTRSKGIDMALGEYVMFIDDDDWWLHPKVLEIIDRDTNANPEVDCYCYGFIFGSLGYKRPYDNAPGRRLFPNVWSKVWKRQTIGDTRFPHVHYCSDMYFSSAMVDKGINIRTSDEPIYFYNYMREGSISHEDHEKGIL